MNSNSNPEPQPDPRLPGTPRPRFRSPWPLVGSVVCALAGAWVAYSLYVFQRVPDAQELVVLGQTRLASEGPAGLRILVRNRITGRPIEGALVSLKLVAEPAWAPPQNSAQRPPARPGWAQPVNKVASVSTPPISRPGACIFPTSFSTDPHGSLSGAITISNAVPGRYSLRVEAVSRWGRDQVVRQIELCHPLRLLLTTDKPLYQPGQTIHLRSLLLDGCNHKPAAGEKVTFEITDSKGNKVFKETRPGSAFGIASTDFVLAEELNLGRYQVRAQTSDAFVERVVEIQRYVLPKFKLRLSTDLPAYLPGQTISGSVRADYFFGKPVAGAAVTLRVATLQDQPVTLTELAGRTDDSGRWNFRVPLPETLLSLPPHQERVALELTAQVSDSARQVASRAASVWFARNGLELAAVPESGLLAPGVENLLYVLAAYPDGQPAPCKIFVKGAAFQSDPDGVCAIPLVPADSGRPLQITAIDPAGSKASLSFQPETDAASAPLAIRTDRAVYESGQAAQVTLLSPETNRTVFIDLIKAGQTVLTRSVELSAHRGGDGSSPFPSGAANLARASLSLPLPATLSGPVTLHAYWIDADGEDQGQSRIIYIQPASALHIHADLGKAEYRPGEIASVNFRVTDAEGRPAPSALGISVVDESLFALDETRPGLFHQLLDLGGEELSSPRLFPGFSRPAALLSRARDNQLLARAYLSSLERPKPRESIEQLIKEGYLHASMLEYLKSRRGTRQYERLRQSPAYAEVINLLEAGHGDYSLREATAPFKARAVKAQRDAYAAFLGKCFMAGLGVLLLLLVLFLSWNRSWSFIEVLVLLAFLAILAAMLLPALSSAKTKGSAASLAGELKQIELASQMARADAADSGSPAQAPSARLRRDFPETLFWLPQLITDDQGKASLELPLADSITTWRASIDAVSPAGKLGGTELPLRVFQDFFVDLDLPVSLTLNDQVAIPVTCYNYLKEPQEIRLRLTPSDWFEASAAAPAPLQLGPGEIRTVHFPLQVLKVGRHTLKVSAQGSRSADALERTIRVLPSGERIEYTRNGNLQASFADTFLLPSNAIPDSQRLLAKFYPSRFSEIVEGLDSIFQAPYGCFEQTSSTTYPNILALDYLRRVGRLTPPIEAKARAYINAGYQRLLTFEVPGGGFEWFGHSPAHVGLTAYGILEFIDMSRVHPVDAALIQRTLDWLCSQQNADGSWNRSGGLDSFHDSCPATAYVAWVLAETCQSASSLDRALSYLRSHPAELDSVYQTAMAANAFLARANTDAFGLNLADQLRQQALRDSDKTVHWNSNGRSLTYSRGWGLEVETTALSVMALIKAGVAPQEVKQALTWISRNKRGDGTWGSTQATILAMRALLAGSAAALGQEFESAITVSLNGRTIETLQINKTNNDLLRQVDLTPYLRPGANLIELLQSPSGELPMQLAADYWLAAAQAAESPAAKLQLGVTYDRALVSVNDSVRCAVAVRNLGADKVNMALVELGIPAGFEVDAGAFESLREQGQIARFEQASGRVVLYLRELSENVPFQFEYRLRAKYPLRVQTPPCAVYEYYQPKNRAQSQPTILTVEERRR